MAEGKIVIEFDVRADRRMTLFESTKQLSSNKKVRKILRREEDG